jgi:hypothetical protein
MLDGELYSGDRMNCGPGPTGSDVASAAVDMLELGGREVMGALWTDREERRWDTEAVHSACAGRATMCDASGRSGSCAGARGLVLKHRRFGLHAGF